MADIVIDVLQAHYDDLLKLIYDKGGYNAAYNALTEVNRLYTGTDIKEQINILNRYIFREGIAGETSEIGTQLVYASGKSSGLYGVTVSEPAVPSIIEGSYTEIVSANSAFGTEIVEVAGKPTVQLATIGRRVGQTAGTIGDFVVGEVLPAVGAAAAGVALGVTVDDTLYRLAPRYWDEHLPTLNPQTWDDIILGRDTKIPFLHNTRDGKSYISEDMLAYVAMLGESDGWYKSDYYTETSDLTSEFAKYNVVSLGQTIYAIYTDPSTSLTYPAVMSIDVGEFVTFDNGIVKSINIAIDTNSRLPVVTYYVPTLSKTETYDFNRYPAYFRSSYTYDSKTVYYSASLGWSYYRADISKILNWTTTTDTVINQAYIMWIAIYGDKVAHGGKEGINKIGTTPDLTGITTLDGAKQKLRDTYPSLYDNKLETPEVTEDGTEKTNTWLPVPMPDNSTTPTTDGYNQTDDGTYPSESVKTEILETTITETTIINPPANPINPIISEPDSPIPIIPDVPTSTGMGAVYVPTIEQVRNFSAWLWSDSFIDQIKKLFSDPMQGIVGLHQVYFSPSHDGTTTIHCGYLDSNVPSDYTTNRYYTLDCGSISVSEIYGNVFDYDPYTNIELYLPFIGIVPLNTGDVMRGTLNVKYICDVLTGACLANIYVMRDGSNNILYTYGGNCAVQYPLSSGSYMGIITALAGAGVSIGTAIATGGMSIPLSIAGGAAAVMNGKTNVATSGGYGGNTGAMGVKKPYVIIKTTRTAMPNNYQKFTGQPYNNVIKLSSCRGFTQANILHLDADYNITQAEADEIATYLSQGVII